MTTEEAIRVIESPRSDRDSMDRAFAVLGLSNEPVPAGNWRARGLPEGVTWREYFHPRPSRARWSLFASRTEASRSAPSAR
jgi:hypothetical protein